MPSSPRFAFACTLGGLLVLGGSLLGCEPPAASGAQPADPPVTEVTAPSPDLASDTTEVVRLSAQAARAYLENTPDAQVVDVRTAEEIADTGTLAAAKVLDFRSPDFEEQAVAALDPERPVVLFCRSGNRAGQAAEHLVQRGFASVFNVGGFEDLAATGLPTTTP
ncbi:MAG: rhodanese-like domain-containing protein [Bacteroidota bacterium]